MFEKILVPLDSSIYAEQALPPTVELARSFESAVDLINICETHMSPESGACQLYLEDKAALVKNALPGHPREIKAEIIIGPPGQKILSYAKQEKADLIIMSSHGLSGVTLWPLGSTVDRVLRQTGQPILIVRVKPPQEALPPRSLFKRILVPLDASELSARVIPYVVEIASRLKSQVVLFHVVQTDKHMHTLGRIDSVPIREEEMASLIARSEEYLSREKGKFDNAGVAVTSVVKSGNVAEEIIKYASDQECSLIAQSSHGHSGFEAWIIGSVTTKILHAGNKSLLFVPAVES
jgi:nucleotide-binding universal stress UspA family protein